MYLIIHINLWCIFFFKLANIQILTTQDGIGIPRELEKLKSSYVTDKREKWYNFYKDNSVLVTKIH